MGGLSFLYFIKESSRQNGVARAEAIQKEVRSMYPTIENIKEIAAKGQYKRVRSAGKYMRTDIHRWKL